jgi:hypothetical protein
MWCILATSNYFDERESKSIRRAPPAVGLSDHTCTLGHLDVTDDIDASLALCHLHNSIGGVQANLQAILARPFVG